MFRVSFLVILSFLTFSHAWAEYPFSDSQIADAIYIAEGGTKTNHPYGMLTKYKHTSARQACLNTISHAKKDWNSKGDFIAFLGKRYAPINAENDPTGLNINWVRNVNYFLMKEEPDEPHR